MGTLPPGFEDLEPFSDDWNVASVGERYERRKASTQAELTRFYEAVQARMEAMLAHLDPFDIYALPEPERRLYRILCGLCEASAAVELIGAPYLVPPDGHDLDYRKALEIL
ncbi:hypothetical protein M9978_07765 [Sphingomonas sp. MG17]|uniref:Uncharacterized protein n=1 Tax=Sphingomonas tagetis TaxID=2949092 RepID=A0A9X2HMD1_9SPHN|nr:hypothetical protein [Sphingomonas tagetis]MCP3730324.1 hypothetical protein [Sphingomonas tagetis]